MIAGDHLHGHPSGAAGLHRVDGFRPRRVHHRLKAEECEAGGDVLVAQVIAPGRQLAAREGQDAKAPSGQLVYLREDGGGVQRDRRPGRVQRRRAARQDLLDSALQVDEATSVAGVVKRRHILVLALERDRVASLEGGPLDVAVEAGLAGARQQRRLGGVAGDVPAPVGLHQRRVVAEQAGA